MSKAILEIDMPKGCGDCILRNDHNICIVTGYNNIGMEAEFCPLIPIEDLPKQGTYQCFNCGQNTVIWMSDFDFADYGIYGEGIVHVCQCANCGAEIEYYCPIEESNEVQ